MVVAKSRRELCAFIADSIHTTVHGHIQGYDFSSFKVDDCVGDGRSGIDSYRKPYR